MDIIGMALKGRLPDYDARYVYSVQWLFEESNRPVPEEMEFSEPRQAIDAMIKLFNTPKTLVHISLTRRNA